MIVVSKHFHEGKLCKNSGIHNKLTQSISESLVDTFIAPGGPRQEPDEEGQETNERMKSQRRLK